MSRYSEKILNEFYNPQNVGVIRGASGKGKVINEQTGEIYKIYIVVKDNKIVDAEFQTFGSVASIAATSVATRLILGKTLEEASKLTVKDITDELGAFPKDRSDCVLYAVKAANNAALTVGQKLSDDE